MAGSRQDSGGEQQLEMWAYRPIRLPEDEGRTLAQAQEQFNSSLSEGRVECPCCGKPAAKYRRHLNSTQARGLIWLVRESGALRAWVNIQEGPSWLLRSKQLSTLRLWNLLERGDADPDDPQRPKRSGLYRPTVLGVDFVYGRRKVPRWCLEYTGVPEAYSDERVSIRSALGKEFDYFELMGWTPAAVAS